MATLTPSARRRRRHASERVTWQDFTMGAVLGGVVGLIAGAALGLTRRTTPRRLIVGGVDLSSIDLSRPFRVNLSVLPQSSPEEKRAALHRLRSTLLAFSERFPTWLCEPDVSVQDGRFVLHITPIDHPALRVVRSLGQP